MLLDLSQHLAIFCLSWNLEKWGKPDAEATQPTDLENWGQTIAANIKNQASEKIPPFR